MKWQLKIPISDQTIQSLSSQLAIDSVLSKLLVLRGITTFDQAKHFFRPVFEDLHDPFLMKGMWEAVQIILKAKEQKHSVLVLGDYDVDGVTSASMLYLYGKAVGIDIQYYIPDRYKEGYGISFQSIDHAHSLGISLMISIDCGTTSIKEVDYALEKGIDFIICDHHTPSGDLPRAKAILNPKQEDCTYPYKELSACAVGFKLIQALNLNFGLDIKSYLDLVAISIAADIVPITGENRVLLSLGIAQLKKNTRVGLKPLLSCLDLEHLTCSDLVFKVAPKINAAGRIKHGSEAVTLIVAQDVLNAEQVHRIICRYNETRKTIENEIVNQALRMLSAEDPQRKTNVMFGNDWHKGVIGIVASKIIEHHYKPTVVFAQIGDRMYASVRSVKGFDVYKAISDCGHLLENFGGHKYAAGLTMKAEHFDSFKTLFESVVAQNINEDQRSPVISIDSEIDLESINPKFLRILDQMGPFGPDNMNPVFIAHNLKTTAPPSIIGKDQTHLKAKVYQKNPQWSFDVVGFGLSESKPILEQGSFSAVFSIGKNYWQGMETVQLLLKYVYYKG